LSKIATGHTLDDQAETVLMRLIRGAGLKGLGGIYPRIAVEDDAGEMLGEIVRPMLGVRRHELESYLTDIKQSWREDATNLDIKFTRNRVRKLLVPVIEKEFNPSVAQNLTELAEIARGEEDYWDNEVAGWMGTAVQWSEPEWAQGPSEGGKLVQIALASGASSASSKSQSQRKSGEDSDLESKIDDAPWLVADAILDRFWFLSQPVAVQRRVVKAIGEHAGIPLNFRHVDETVRFAEADGPGKEVSLPHGWKVVRQPGQLLFVTPDLREPAPAPDYEYELSVPGKVSIGELGVTIEVRCVSADATAGYNPQHLLDAESLPGPLRVRNWRPGDRFWPDHTKSPKKIKELLQERHVPQPDRALWPVIESRQEIIWMRDFAPAKRFGRKPGRPAILIEVQAFQ
jgi:tRNA(Ile)-lysidine synthase